MHSMSFLSFVCKKGGFKEMIRINDAIASFIWIIFICSGAYKLAIVV
jgi:hypothetical protein